MVFGLGKNSNKKADEHISTEYAVELNKCFEEKRYEDGLKLIESNFNEKSEADWYTKGNLLKNLHRDQEALECYNNAISLDEFYVKAWYRKGECLLYQECFLESAKSFEKVIEIETNNKKQLWSSASGFYCMISYISEREEWYKKGNIPKEIDDKTNYWLNIMNDFLYENKLVPKFTDVKKIVEYCYNNYSDILHKLEPSIVTEFRYETGFFKKKIDSIKTFKNPDGTYSTEDEIKKSHKWSVMYPEGTTRLSKRGFDIVMNFVVENNKNIIMDGDIALNNYVLPKFRQPISCIQLLFKKNEKKTEEFVLELANRLLNSGEEVKVIHRGSMFIIESLKNDKWGEVVAVLPKGYLFS